MMGEVALFQIAVATIVVGGVFIIAAIVKMLIEKPK